MTTAIFAFCLFMFFRSILVTGRDGRIFVGGFVLLVSALSFPTMLWIEIGRAILP